MYEDAIVENLLKEAAREAQNREIEILEKELQAFGLHEFSEVFKSRMNKLIILSRKPYFPVINTIGKKVAIILVIFTLALSTIIMGVEAVREPVFQFFVEVYEKFSSIIFPNTRTFFPESIENTYEPKYIPNEYSLSESFILTTTTQFIYTNNSGDELIYMQYVITSNILNVDTENVEIQKILNGGKEALFYSNKGINNLIWTDNGYGYQISGLIHKDEMVKMMESVHLKNNQ